MKVHRRLRGSTAAPTSGRHRWLAAALVVMVLVAMTVWIGYKLSKWPPPPPSEQNSAVEVMTSQPV